MIQPPHRLDYAADEHTPAGLPPVFRRAVEVALGLGGLLGLLVSFAMVALSLGWWGEGYDDPRRSVVGGVSLGALSLAAVITAIRWARRDLR